MKWNNPRCIDISADNTLVWGEKTFVWIFMPLNLCVSICGSQIESKTCSKALPDSTEKQEGRHYFCVSPSPQCPITISCRAFRCPLSPSIFRDRFLRKSRCQDGVGVSIRSDVSRRWTRMIRRHGNVQMTYGGGPFGSVHDRKRNFCL